MIIFLACELWLFQKATRVHSDFPDQILTQGTTQLHRNCCNNSCLWLRLDINFRVIGNPDSSEVFRNNITALGFIKAELFPTGLGESIKVRHWRLLALWNFNLPVSHGGWDIFDCHLCNSSYNNFSVENVPCFPIEIRSICVVYFHELVLEPSTVRCFHWVQGLGSTDQAALLCVGHPLRNHGAKVSCRTAAALLMLS